MNAMNNELLDGEIIETFLELGAEVFRDLIDLYMDTSTSEITQLNQQILAKDLDAVRKTAHSLKGASLNTGAKAMGQLCLQIEIGAKENNLDTVTVLAAQLTVLLEKTIIAFREAIPG